MGLELVLRTTNYKPRLVTRIICDDCNRLLHPKEAVICWSYVFGNIGKQKVLCINKCAGSSENMNQLPVSSLIKDLKFSYKQNS